MTNDRHNGDNVERSRVETTLKEVCTTPQPNRNVSYATLLGPNVCMWASLRSRGHHRVLLNLWSRGTKEYRRPSL